MAWEIKLASNLAPFSRLCDRFVPTGYTGDMELDEQLERLSKVKGISGTAFAWPGSFKSGAEMRKALGRHGLRLATLDTNIYADAMFKDGSLSNRDPKVRREAIDRAKGASDAAAEAGAPDVNFWMGHDGFEYPFQGHYADAWNWIVEGLREISDHNPSLPISVEPKCKEPRANSYLANMGKALLLVNKINKPHVGVTLDFGHSLAALENPSEVAVLAHREGRLQQIHLNDNYRDWDHDLIPGAVNVWDHVEFFYWLRKLGYTGWFLLDIYPYRDNGVEVLERSVQVCQTCCRIADKLVEMNVEQLQRDGRHLEILGRLWAMMGR